MDVVDMVTYLTTKSVQIIPNWILISIFPSKASNLALIDSP